MADSTDHDGMQPVENSWFEFVIDHADDDAEYSVETTTVDIGPDFGRSLIDWAERRTNGPIDGANLRLHITDRVKGSILKGGLIEFFGKTEPPTRPDNTYPFKKLAVCFLLGESAGRESQRRINIYPDQTTVDSVVSVDSVDSV